MKISREIKAGLIALIALVALIWGISFLKGTNLFENHRNFYAVYQNVDGLGQSGPININGYKVGQVDDIYFHPDGSGKLMVRFQITEDFPIPKNSVARIYSADLLGEKAIALQIGDSPEIAQSGDTLQASIQRSLSEEVNQQVAPLRDKAEELLGSIDSVIMLTSGFLNDDTRRNFAETFESVSRSFRTLEHSVNTFDTTLTRSQDDIVETSRDLSAVMATIADNRDELDGTFKNIKAISDSLAELRLQKTLNELNRAAASVESITAKIDTGKGSLSRIINEPELYQNLTETTEHINRLLLDLKYNPKRYVNFSLFGNTKEYSEEEIIENEERLEKQREERENNSQQD